MALTKEQQAQLETVRNIAGTISEFHKALEGYMHARVNEGNLPNSLGELIFDSSKQHTLTCVYKLQDIETSLLSTCKVVTQEVKEFKSDEPVKANKSIH
jgi:hypothetical protein